MARRCPTQIQPTLLPQITSDLADIFWFIGLELEEDKGRAEAEKKPLIALIQELLVRRRRPARLPAQHSSPPEIATDGREAASMKNPSHKILRHATDRR